MINYSIYEFNTSTMAYSRTFSHPEYKCSSFYVRTSVSPDNTMIASGSSCCAYLWEIKRGDMGNMRKVPPLKLIGHEKEVCGIAFHTQDIGQVSQE